jgi:hypothetical protein
MYSKSTIARCFAVNAFPEAPAFSESYSCLLNPNCQQGGRTRICQVKASGDDVRNLFVGIVATQNSHHGVKFFIQTWCAQRRDKWPKDGETITIDLDEVQITRQR